MRSLTLVLACVATPALAAADALPGAPVQSPASYEAAIHNRSTSPSYVLITVVDDTTATARSTCTVANFLRGALAREHGLRHDGAGADSVDAVALANRDHVFHFTKPEALANIPARYSQQDLAAARAILSPLPDAELKGQFSSLYRHRETALDRLPREAVACALIERGLWPKQADRSGQVYAGGDDHSR